MATYSELRELFTNSDLLEKAEVACVIAANDFLDNAPTIAQKAWAGAVLTNPKGEAEKAVKSILADKKGATVAVILGLSDNNIKTRVGEIAQHLVDAMAGG
ncbi:hypothetical protein OAE19_05245 [Porticoccaceae bacterium]|nr:hypothetical protein [Porticoccaceae bacterium]